MNDLIAELGDQMVANHHFRAARHTKRMYIGTGILNNDNFSWDRIKPLRSAVTIPVSTEPPPTFQEMQAAWENIIIKVDGEPIKGLLPHSALHDRQKVCLSCLNEKINR